MKAGLVAALWAAEAVRAAGVRLRGGLVLASVLGEEDGGLLTFATLRRGWRADACVIPEPTSLAMITANSGALTFRLRVRGEATHAARKADGVSAIEKFWPVWRALEDLERRRHEAVDPRMARWALAHPISIGRVSAGDWPSSVPDLLVAAGRMGVAIGEPVEAARRALEEAVADACAGDPWLRARPVEVDWWGGAFASGALPGASDLADRVGRADRTARGSAAGPDDRSTCAGWPDASARRAPADRRYPAPVHPEALVFDFDGTLVDTETAEFEAVRQVWADHGHHYGPERWTPWVGTVAVVPWLDDLERALGEPIDRDGLRRRARAYNRELLHLVRPRPGVTRLLAEATAAGVPLAIASNAPSDWVEHHLDRLGLFHHFEPHGAVVTVDRVRRPKPDPEPYLTAVGRLGAAPARSVGFEDSTTGLASAQAAGLFTVAVPGPMSEGHDLAVADRCCASLDELDLLVLGTAVARRA
jgi:HAD superfamily hydrolase (TIGR01509 family)